VVAAGNVSRPANLPVAITAAKADVSAALKTFLGAGAIAAGAVLPVCQPGCRSTTSVEAAIPRATGLPRAPTASDHPDLARATALDPSTSPAASSSLRKTT